jgi:hypothetical protein
LTDFVFVVHFLIASKILHRNFIVLDLYVLANSEKSLFLFSFSLRLRLARARERENPQTTPKDLQQTRSGLAREAHAP